MLVYLSTKCENEAFAGDAPFFFCYLGFFFKKASFKVGSCYRFLWRSVKRKVATPPSIVASIPASDQDLPFPPSLSSCRWANESGGREASPRQMGKEEGKKRGGTCQFFSPPLRGDNGGRRGKRKRNAPLFLSEARNHRAGGHECLFLLFNSCDGKPPSTQGGHKEGGGGGNKLIGFRRRRRRPPPLSSASALP